MSCLRYSQGQKSSDPITRVERELCGKHMQVPLVQSVRPYKATQRAMFGEIRQKEFQNLRTYDTTYLLCPLKKCVIFECTLNA
jgi:hypothetical protein